MPKRIITATSQNPTDPRLYFFGYQDEGETSEPQWTLNRDYACWFDADEAEVEAKLLAAINNFVGHVLSPEHLGT
jgi:hypothetical protein